MFVGNQFAQQILDKLFTQIKTTNQVSIPFLIISGPSHIGKTSIAIQHIKGLLGNYFLQDFLHIKDFSGQIGKQHFLKIKKKGGEVTDILEKEYNYDDIGTREINNRLAQSSLSGRKICLIENIDRMTIGATNALLKTCEEPLPGRLIVATTSSLNLLLDTIVSRAFLVQMQTVGMQDMNNLAKDIFPKKNPDEIQDFINISMGKPGILYNLTDESKQEYYKSFFQEINELNKVSSISDKFIIIKNIHKNYDIFIFFDYILSTKTGIGEEIVYCKKMRNANVNKESVLLRIAQILSR